MDLFPSLPPLAGGSVLHDARRRHRRCASAPSLDSMAEAALRLETTPCSVLELHSLDDDVSKSLRRTLQGAQCELLSAVQAGVLRGSGDGNGGPAGSHRHDGSDSGEGASDGEAPSRRRSGSGERGAGGGGGQQQGQQGVSSGSTDGDLELQLELAGLSEREREAALKRAKNREAARRSRERKAERIAALRGEVDRLRSNNFVLLKCVEEVAQKALAARAEQKQLRDKLAKLQMDPEQAPPAAAAVATANPLALLGDPNAAGACTPPAARRAAALEAELLAMEAAPASPTQLLLPQWPEQAAAAAPASAPVLPRPTSAELRRDLRRAVAGDGRDSGAWAATASGSAGMGGPAGGYGHRHPAGSAADHHLLHPSPVAARLARHPQQQQGCQEQGQQQGQQQQQQGLAAVLPPSVLVLKQQQQQGPGDMHRTCSAPGGLSAADCGAGGHEAVPASDAQPWFSLPLAA